MSLVRIVAAGDAALVAEFEDRIDVAVNARVIALSDALRGQSPTGVRDVVPTFRSVTVYFDPLLTDVGRLTARMHEADAGYHDRARAGGVSIDLPVCYDPEFAPDLDDVARFGRLGRDDVVAVHSAPAYRVFMLGFVPGFAYLGTVDSRIAAPRRSTPRLKVPAGSVAIAGHQTGIYPRQTPGGWNIVGRTPAAILSFARDEPALLKAGDIVRFRPIGRVEFDRLATDAGSAR
jgi:inhibitor of KinA